MEVAVDESKIEEVFLKGLQESRRKARMYGRKQAEKRREKEKSLQDNLTLAQLALEDDPDDLETQ